MKNKDLIDLTKEEIKQKALEAITSGNPEEQVEVLEKYFETLAKEVRDEFDRNIKLNDNAVLAQRGANALTSEEIKFYEKLATAIKTKQALTEVDNILPTTVIDRVFEDLEKNHPLLQYINFQNVTGLTQIIARDGEIENAWWGDLTEEIKKQLQMAFKKIDVNTLKLSAYLPLAKAHADLGPKYLDAFVRRVLSESISMALEKAILVGDGNKKPIGMNRDLDGSVTKGVYPEKIKLVIKDLSLKTIGDLFARLTDDGKRVVPNVIFVVNSYDYNAKIKPALYHLTASGEYVINIPYPITFIESCAIDKGTAIVGMPNKYFAGIGSTQKIDKSDECRFLEDETVYLSKMYGIGMPFDNISFIYLDVSTLDSAPIPLTEKLDVSTKEDLYGKNATDLVENAHIFEDGSVVGKLKNITDYEKFSSNSELQKGHFFPIDLKVKGKTVTISKNGGQESKTAAYEDFIVLRVTEGTTYEISVDNETVATLNFKYATFDAPVI